ncbi:hypothetical protein E5288_WYG009463 [Bos mutus]|uniref:Uncharacterized protein n=1 Tax=Bos mutus TaxID=72004 RepID=A0A6B0SI15_9CETA|nr:hypothetical protein [Bos mutus]
MHPYGLDYGCAARREVDEHPPHQEGERFWGLRRVHKQSLWERCRHWLRPTPRPRKASGPLPEGTERAQSQAATELSTLDSDPEPRESLPLRQQEDLGPTTAEHRSEEDGSVQVRQSGVERRAGKSQDTEHMDTVTGLSGLLLRHHVVFTPDIWPQRDYIHIGPRAAGLVLGPAGVKEPGDERGGTKPDGILHSISDHCSESLDSRAPTGLTGGMDQLTRNSHMIRPQRDYIHIGPRAAGLVLGPAGVKEPGDERGGTKPDGILHSISDHCSESLDSRAPTGLTGGMDQLTRNSHMIRLSCYSHDNPKTGRKPFASAQLSATCRLLCSLLVSLAVMNGATPIEAFSLFVGQMLTHVYQSNGWVSAP